MKRDFDKDGSESQEPLIKRRILSNSHVSQREKSLDNMLARIMGGNERDMKNRLIELLENSGNGGISASQLAIEIEKRIFGEGRNYDARRNENEVYDENNNLVLDFTDTSLEREEEEFDVLDVLDDKEDKSSSNMNNEMEKLCNVGATFAKIIENCKYGEAALKHCLIDILASWLWKYDLNILAFKFEDDSKAAKLLLNSSEFMSDSLLTFRKNDVFERIDVYVENDVKLRHFLRLIKFTEASYQWMILKRINFLNIDTLGRLLASMSKINSDPTRHETFFVRSEWIEINEFLSIIILMCKMLLKLRGQESMAAMQMGIDNKLFEVCETMWMMIVLYNDVNEVYGYDIKKLRLFYGLFENSLEKLEKNLENYEKMQQEVEDDEDDDVNTATQCYVNNMKRLVSFIDHTLVIDKNSWMLAAINNNQLNVISFINGILRRLSKWILRDETCLADLNGDWQQGNSCLSKLIYWALVIEYKSMGKLVNRQFLVDCVGQVLAQRLSREQGVQLKQGLRDCLKQTINVDIIKKNQFTSIVVLLTKQLMENNVAK